MRSRIVAITIIAATFAVIAYFVLTRSLIGGDP